MGLIKEGNLAASLPWLVETLKHETGDPRRATIQRLRIGSILRAAPRPLRIWSAGKPVETVAFSPDGQWVLMAGEDGAMLAGPVGRRFVAAAQSTGLAAGSDAFRTCWRRSARTAASVLFSVGSELYLCACRCPSQPAVGDRPPPRGCTWRCRFQPGLEARCRVARLTRVRLGYGEPPRSGRPLELPDLVRHLAFSHDGRLLLAGYGGPDKGVGGASLWRLGPGPRIPPVNLAHEDDVFWAEFSPDDRRIVTAGYDRSVKLWDAASGSQRKKRPYPAPVTLARFSPDGRHILTVCGAAVQILDAQSLDSEVAPMRHRADPPCGVQPAGRSDRLVWRRSDRANLEPLVRRAGYASPAASRGGRPGGLRPRGQVPDHRLLGPDGPALGSFDRALAHPHCSAFRLGPARGCWIAMAALLCRSAAMVPVRSGDPRVTTEMR